MLPFFLYLLAGAITGLHIFTLLLLAANSAPLNPLEVVALLGSLVVLIAAYVSLFRPRAAAKIALVGALAMWCFYGPAIANAVRIKMSKRSVLSQATMRQVAPACSDFG